MLKVHLDPYMCNEIVLFYTSYCSSNRSNSCLSLLYQYFLKKNERVCQNVHILFLCTKPRLSQARALLFPKVFVPLGIQKFSL